MQEPERCYQVTYAFNKDDLFVDFIVADDFQSALLKLEVKLSLEGHSLSDLVGVSILRKGVDSGEVRQ